MVPFFCQTTRRIVYKKINKGFEHALNQEMNDIQIEALIKAKALFFLCQSLL
jgi:hypothetical protein